MGISDWNQSETFLMSLWFYYPRGVIVIADVSFLLVSGVSRRLVGSDSLLIYAKFRYGLLLPIFFSNF